MSCRSGYIEKPYLKFRYQTRARVSVPSIASAAIPARRSRLRMVQSPESPVTAKSAVAPACTAPQSRANCQEKYCQ